MTKKTNTHSPENARENQDRRGFLQTLSSLAMAGGMAAGYGTFGAIAGRYLYPAAPGASQWMFLTDLGSMEVGDSIAYTTPAGAKVTVTRQAREGTSDDFIALSSVCPHLGCQVHWESQNDRYFCPCHNGVFDPSGKATGGPPAEAGQSLPEYPLKVEKDLLFIEVPSERLVHAGDPEKDSTRLADNADKPGVDPCLQPPREIV